MFSPTGNSEFVRVKDHVILTRGEDYMLCQIENNNTKVKFFNTPIDLSHIVDKPFWSIYKVTRVKKNNYCMLQYCNPNEVNVNIVETCEKGLDNRSIEDDNSSQALSKEEILDMKSSGQPNNEILNELIKNSKSFSLKTEFAQEKYVKKKSKKYSDFIQVLKPNIRLLAKVLLVGNITAPYLGLRSETLTQLKTSLSFQPDGKYILYEHNCHGLIIAFLLDAMSSKGKLLNLVTANYQFNKLKAVKAMQFPEEKLSQLMHIRSHVFLKHSKYHENFDSGDLNTDADPNDENLKRKQSGDDRASEKRTKELELQSEEVKKLAEEPADGLIFVCKEVVTSSNVGTMLQFLAPSRPFVVYCQFREPLVKLFSELKQRNDATFLRIFENSKRMYQVLPDRTHPYNLMFGSSGFILSGVTIDSEEVNKSNNSSISGGQAEDKDVVVQNNTSSN